jgi:hypothetical protein
MKKFTEYMKQNSQRVTSKRWLALNSCKGILFKNFSNPSYSGGRDQEDLGLKPAQANSLRDPISKNNHKNGAGGMPQPAGPEFKPQYHFKK